MNKFLRAVLVASLFGMSMLYLGTVRAGSIDWSIHFDLLLPAPHHGHGHDHRYNPEWRIMEEKGIRPNFNPWACANYYHSYGCNHRGRNCRVLPPQECVEGHLVPRQQHGHTHHRHDWRCYENHWHGHQHHNHHWNGEHRHSR